MAHAVVADQPDQADQALHTKAPVGAGHEAERVCVRCSCRSWVMVPVWPAGQAKACDAVRISVLVWVLGVGTEHTAAQVLDTTDQADTLDTGEPLAEGQVHDTVRCSVMAPTCPFGQVNVRPSVVDAGAEHAGVQLLAICPQLPHAPAPEHTNDRWSVMLPNWPGGQARLRVSGPGHGAQLLPTAVQAVVLGWGAPHASGHAQVVVRCSVTAPTCPFGQVSVRASLEAAGGEQAATVEGGDTLGGTTDGGGVAGLTGVAGGATLGGASTDGTPGAGVTGATGAAGPTGPTGPTGAPTGAEVGGITPGEIGGSASGGAATTEPATSPEW